MNRKNFSFPKINGRANNKLLKDQKDLAKEVKKLKEEIRNLLKNS